jgi:hypothetical protein
MAVRWDAVVQDNDFWSERARLSPSSRASGDGRRRPGLQLFGSLPTAETSGHVNRGPFVERWTGRPRSRILTG